MAIETSNLQLIKPESTDFYDIAVQNENMDRIDEAIAGKADKTDIPIATSSQVGGLLSGSEISVDEKGNAHIELEVLVADDDEEVVAPAPLNADMLGGKTAEYFDSKIVANSGEIGRLNNNLVNGSTTLNNVWIPVHYVYGANLLIPIVTTKTTVSLTKIEVFTTTGVWVEVSTTGVAHRIAGTLYIVANANPLNLTTGTTYLARISGSIS